MLTNSERPSGVEWMPVISHSFGPTRKRRRVAPGALPIRVVTVLVVVTFAAVVRVLLTTRVPPSPTEPGMAASSMQLVTSV